MKLLGAAVIAAAVIPFVWVSGTYAHDMKALEASAKGDDRRSDWFKSLKQPGGKDIGCCSLTDCRQTEAKQLPSGNWVAVLKDYLGSRWVNVPPEKVLKRPLSIDGEAYICNSDGYRGGFNYAGPYGGGGGGVYYSAPMKSEILCFIPPIPGY